MLNIVITDRMPCSEVTETAASPVKKSRTEEMNGNTNTVLKFAKLTENATTPSRGSIKSAGYDLYRYNNNHL